MTNMQLYYENSENDATLILIVRRSVRERRQEDERGLIDKLDNALGIVMIEQMPLWGKRVKIKGVGKVYPRGDRLLMDNTQYRCYRGSAESLQTIEGYCREHSIPINEGINPALKEAFEQYALEPITKS